MKLNQDQERVYQGLKESDSKVNLVVGRAGTGKTTSIFKYLVDSGNPVLLLAPTNKAVWVLYKASLEWGLDPNKTQCLTIHKALGLELSTRSEANYVLHKCGPKSAKKERKNALEKGSKSQIVVIDESSMIDDSVYFNILKYQDEVGKIIFMGDDSQLPPVADGAITPIFSIQPRFELKHVVRQQGSLVEWLENCRNHVKSGKPFLPRPSQDTPILDKFSARLKMVRDNIDPDNVNHFRVLAFTHKEVDNWCEICRELVFGESMEYHPGEPVIFTKPFPLPNKKFISTSTEATIVSIQDNQIELDIPGVKKRMFPFISMAQQKLDRKQIQQWQRRIKELEDTILDNSYLPDSSEYEFYKAEIDQLHRKILKLGKKNVPIRSAFALTIHNSQGSTFDKGLILTSGLEYVGTDTRNRLWYTAASRFRHGFGYC